MSENYVLVSSDSHAGPRTPEYRAYIAKRYHDDFDRYLGQRAEARRAFLERLGIKDLTDSGMRLDDARDPEAYQAGIAGLWDPAIKLEVLDREGVAGEVIFVDGSHDNEVAFGPMAGSWPNELRVEGGKAHNRWIAEFCSLAPERLTGVAYVLPYDMDDTVADIRDAHRNGLRGGVWFPCVDVPPYHDAAWDNVWATCAELGMPVNSHGLIDGFNSGLTAVDLAYRSHSLLWQFILGGVFDRFPNLKLVFTEQGADWIPAVLRNLDHYHNSPRGSMTGLAKSPREYWAEHCRVGASFLSQAEMTRRDELGIGTIMWGMDFPHPEGTWLETPACLRDAFVGLTDAEMRRIAGLNAAELYGFDLDVLAPVVDRIGLPPGAFDGGEVREFDYHPDDFSQGHVFTAEIAKRRGVRRAMAS